MGALLDVYDRVCEISSPSNLMRHYPIATAKPLDTFDRRAMLRGTEKPHITRFAGEWMCTGGGLKALGDSPERAFARWVNIVGRLRHYLA